jgi:hypothetical protein
MTKTSMPTVRHTLRRDQTNHMSVSYALTKTANIVQVKVLGFTGSGTSSHVINGDLGATKQASDLLTAACAKILAQGFLANMSLGRGKSLALLLLMLDPASLSLLAMRTRKRMSIYAEH